MKIFRMYNWLVMVTLVAMTACMAGCGKTKTFDDPNANYTDDLLKFVPAKAEVVIAINPQRLLESAGCEWTDDGIKLDDKWLEKLKEMPDGEKNLKKIKEGLKITGVNHNSLVVFCDGVRNWYAMMAITDHDKIDEYLKDRPVDKAQEFDGFKVWNMEKNDGCIIDDSDDGLLWFVTNEEGKDAVKAVQNLKKSAEDKALPDWGRSVLTKENSEVSALVNINAFGVNLTGLLKMAGVDSRLIGEDVAYVGASLAEADHKVDFALTTYNADGKAADLLNPQLRQGADFSAMDALPSQCLSGMGVAVNAQTLISMIPSAQRELNDEQLRGYVNSLRSVAFGFTAMSPRDFSSNNFPNFALTATFNNNQASELFNFIAQMIKSEGIGTVNGNTIVVPMERGVTPFEGNMTITTSGDVIMVTNIPGATVGNSNPMPVSTAGALMACYSKPGAVIGVNIPETGYGLLTPDGLQSHGAIPAEYPGLIASVIDYATNIINQL